MSGGHDPHGDLRGVRDTVDTHHSRHGGASVQVKYFSVGWVVSTGCAIRVSYALGGVVGSGTARDLKLVPRGAEQSYDARSGGRG